MPLLEEEVCCQKFQPNIFDPSRCFSCLRTKKQHSGVPAQEDSDGLSVVSSYCDVTRDRLGYEDGSLCILSPDCALYICDEEDSTTSTRDQSDYPELSGSITSEEDYLHLQDAESHPTMTRLDPPPHRPNPRAWMDEPRGRESFSRHSGSKEERERESGYFSLGRASGIRTPREKSPSPPFRHAEAGRPLPSTRSPEPKATIPFRNPDLGVPSQRRSTDVQSPDPPPISSSPPLHSESNYRQGQRCLSPTPFKVAESLGSSNRRSVDNSYSKGHTTSHSLSQHQQTGRSSSMQRGGTSLSQSTSPSRSTSPFRRTESSGSSHRQNFDSAPFSQRSSRRSRSPSQNSYGRDVDSGGLHRNLKSAVSTVASRVQSSSFEHLKNSLNLTDTKNLSIRHKRSASPVRDGYGGPNQTLLCKTETDTFSNGVSRDSCSFSPSRRGYDSPSQSLLRKTETNASSNNRVHDSRSSSPSRRGHDPPSLSLQRKTETNAYSNNRVHDSRSSSPSRRGHDPPSLSLLRKTETNASSNYRGLDSRSSSPSRRSYDPPNQSLLRKTETSASSNNRFHDSRSSSPSRRGHDPPSQSLLRKVETNTCSNYHSRDSRSSSPSRRGYDPPNQSLLHKTETNASSNNRVHDSRSSSPSRRGHDPLSQSLLRKVETNTSSNYRSRDSRSSSPSRRSYDPPNQSLLHKTETNASSNNRVHDSRSSSPSRRGHDPPSQSLLRKTETNASSNYRGHDSRSSSPSRRGYDPPNQSLLRKTETNASSNNRVHDSRSSSPSRKSYDPPNQSLLRKTETNASFNNRACDSHCSSPPRRGYDPPNQSLLSKAETKASSNNRVCDSRSSTPSRKGYEPASQSLLCKAETNAPSNCHVSDPHSSSPSRKGYDMSLLRNTANSEARSDSSDVKNTCSQGRADANPAYMRKANHKDTRSDPSTSPGSWRGSTLSLRSPPTSRSSSPPRRNKGADVPTNSLKSSSQSTNRGSSRSRTNGRRDLEARSPSPEYRRSSSRNRSPSPQRRRRASSQSSLSESESSHISGGSGAVGFNKEEYAMMADLPKVKTVFQRDGPGQLRRAQSRSPEREERYKPASHSREKHSYWERDESGERGRLNDRERDPRDGLDGLGRLSRSHSSTSVHTQVYLADRPAGNFSSLQTDAADGLRTGKPDLLNFKKGWMSKLDENGEWKKHWFVLTEAGLRYYRDSGAEEKDDLDGEIDLKSCVKVSEFDVEKNYGFQIQTREAVFTLSAMTAGIRRNWIEVLRKSIRPSSSPDLTQLPDSSSDKENSHCLSRPLSSRWSSTRQPHCDPSSEVTTSAATPHRFDYVELAPVPTASPPPAANQREGPEQVTGRETGHSQWEALLHRKEAGSGSNQKLRIEEEIEKKWAEFEKLPLKEMRSLPLIGSRTGHQANEALQREVASLKQQLERLRSGGGGAGGRGGGGCGLEAPCGRSLAAMEKAHTQALEEMQKQHERETRKLERDRDRLLWEETQATAQAMEVLKKAHREEQQREVERVRRLCGGGGDTETLHAQHQSEMRDLRRELDSLSERYSQKCLQLNRAEQSSGEREREISRREREMEQLRKENQELQSSLMEEISHMRTKGQGSEVISPDNCERNSCELEVLLRVKEKEAQYLYREITCLRNELQSLHMEKQTACDRYKEVYAEMNLIKSRSEQEIEALKDHLKLALAALHERELFGNSLEH
ncbi:TRIO and F-actin-binding protein-like isoform X2 [Anguilla rostrata]|uniref:TRIO and F-actin-binding protein-like isoform X2 n=1 Tax=Anguilla rostrata TaxID=7938 RepID=UPI0030D1E631